MTIHGRYLLSILLSIAIVMGFYLKKPSPTLYVNEYASLTIYNSKCNLAGEDLICNIEIKNQNRIVSLKVRQFNYYGETIKSDSIKIIYSNKNSGYIIIKTISGTNSIILDL